MRNPLIGAAILALAASLAACSAKTNADPDKAATGAKAALQTQAQDAEVDPNAIEDAHTIREAGDDIRRATADCGSYVATYRGSQPNTAMEDCATRTDDIRRAARYLAHDVHTPSAVSTAVVTAAELCASATSQRVQALGDVVGSPDADMLRAAQARFDKAAGLERQCIAGLDAAAPTAPTAPAAAPTPAQDALGPAATDRAIKAAFAAASQYGGVDQASIALALAPGADVAAVIGGANAARGFCIDAPNPNGPATKEACGALVRLTLRAAAFGYLYRPPMSGPQDGAIWHKANAEEQAIIDRGIAAAATAEGRKALADLLAGR